MRWLRRPAAHWALLFCAGLASAVACDSEQTGQSASGLCSVGYEDFAGPFLLNWCVGCHSSALPEGQREVFVLANNHGMKYQEISAVLGIPEGTVKSRMHNAVRALRDDLQDLVEL